MSAYEVDPFTVSVADKVALLAQWSNELLAHAAVSHVDASLQQVRECKFYSDGATTATQQRVRLHPQLTAVAVSDDGRFDTMRTLAPPAGRGYEYLGGHGLGLRRRAGRAARPARGQARRPPRSSRATTTWSSTRPTSGSPSTSRSGTPPSWTGRWATRPPTPAPRSPPWTSSATCSTDRRHARHRRPHRRARPGHHRLRRRGRGRPVLGPDQRRRSGRLPARPADGAAQGLRAVERVRVLRRAWPHAAAADGERVAAARPAAPPPRTSSPG